MSDKITVSALETMDDRSLYIKALMCYFGGNIAEFKRAKLAIERRGGSVDFGFESCSSEVSHV